MKKSVIIAKQAIAAESQAATIAAMQIQLDRIEAKIDTALGLTKAGKTPPTKAKLTPEQV